MLKRALFSWTHGVGSGKVSDTIITQKNCPQTLYLRHGHGKALDDNIVVEGLEHVFRCQRVVNSGVFVVVESFQLLLTNIHHLDF